MTSRALVFGGGGVVGVAWETGVAKGLLDAGVDLRAADLIVGTSAGATVGAQLASGSDFAELVARQQAPSDGTVERLNAQADPQAMMALFARLGQVQEMDRATLQEIGRAALAAKTASEADRLDAIARRLGFDAWPATRLLITAVDAESGELRAWDREGEATLVQAVTSSSAVPGLYPPTSIGGRRYIDGGIRSVTNADLARGHELVVVIAPIGTAQSGLGSLAARQLKRELGELRAAGSTVELLQPNAAASAALGPNLMDPARRLPAVEAGVRQGAALAERLREAWAGATAAR